MNNLNFTATLFLLLFVVALHAQNDTIKKKDRLKPEYLRPSIDGHFFPSTSGLKSPFLVTALSANVGMGSTSEISTGGQQIGQWEVPEFRGSIIFTDLNVQYQQRISNRFAAFGAYKFAGRVGTDVPVILADGANTIQALELGALMKVIETKKAILSGTVSYYNVNTSFINMKKYFKDLIERDTTRSIVSKEQSTIVNIGARGAYTISKTFGLQGSATYGYGQSLDGVGESSFYTVGVVGDVDFYPSFKVPFDLALGYTLTTSPEVVMNDGGTSNLFMGKISYSNSRDFELGFQYSYYGIEINSVDDKPHVSKTGLSLKFYF